MATKQQPPQDHLKPAQDAPKQASTEASQPGPTVEPTAVVQAPKQAPSPALAPAVPPTPAEPKTAKILVPFNTGYQGGQILDWSPNQIVAAPHLVAHLWKQKAALKGKVEFIF